MKRRDFLAGSSAALLTAAFGSGAFARGPHQGEAGGLSSNAAKFKLKYAPGFNAFPELAGSDPVDFIKFCSDNGFRAIFDNGLMEKESSLQEIIARELSQHGMDIGPFGLRTPSEKKSMVYADRDNRENWKQGFRNAIETAKRVNAWQVLVIPGKLDPRLKMEYQTGNVIDCLRMLSDMGEKAGLTIVIEPLNQWNHPGMFLTRIPQAYAICRSVNSPNCKIINDIYHQQITEGNIITNIDLAWSEIAAFHIGDVPGRKEPGTGEINFLNIFRHIHEKNYEGVLCMEHGRSIDGPEGERALIEAYRKVDNF